MKSLLKKLSRADRPDRREQLENEAAERIREVGGQAPPEAFASTWAAGVASPAPAMAASAPARHIPPAADAHTLVPTAPARPNSAEPSAPVGRRLTAQERLAARELQSR